MTDEAVGDVLDATESDRRESSIRTRIETAPAAKQRSTTRYHLLAEEMSRAIALIGCASVTQIGRSRCSGEAHGVTPR